MARSSRDGNGAGRQGPGKEESKRPEMSFGPYATGSAMIEIAIWGNLVGENDEKRLMHSVTIRRSYHDDKANEWKESTSYRPQDIPFIVLGLNQAFEWIANERQKK